MDISMYDKADVLRVMYNHAKAQGLGFFHYKPQDMTKQEAQNLLDTGQKYFDYLNGRVLKIDLSKDELRTGLYNRDNGHNAAEIAIASLDKQRRNSHADHQKPQKKSSAKGEKA